MVCPTTAFAAWDSTDLCVVLSFINARERSKTWVEGFKEGDLVLKKILNRRSKMGEHWEGPFEVLGRDGEQGGYRGMGNRGVTG